MKFLCPNCNAKYRIGSEKLVGRQAAKIRCRKCDYRIQIAYRDGSDEYEVTASPTSLAPPAPQPRAPKPVPVPAPPPVIGVPRARSEDEAPAGKRPTAAVPGLPGLGAPRSVRGAALAAAAEAIPAASPVRRPVAPPPPAPVPVPLASAATAPLVAAQPAPAPPAAVPPPAPAPSPPRAGAGTQLADQFRQSVQAGGAAVEEGPQDGWFVGVNGVPLGPIPVGDLKELIAAGHVDRRSLVWREGQAEWRPLGKFPHLARLLDETGVASSAAQPPSLEQPPAPPLPAAAPPAASRTNGHAGGAFAPAVPAEAQDERASEWGDLDEEEDEDEQPTTVKGRVSVAPPGAGAPAAPLPPPPASPTSTGAIPRSALGTATPLSAPPPEGPASTISTTPEPLVDESEASMMRPKRRGRVYAALAVAAAFVLGAILMHAFGSSAPAEAPKAEPTAEPTRALAPTAKAEAPPQPAAEEPPPAPPPQQPETATAAAEATPPPVEGAALAYPVTRPASGQLVPAPEPGSSAPVAKPTGSLLAGLGGPQTPGPAGAAKSGDSQGGGAGLDSTAIQRTVRRYTPAVRQNCWLRALNARAPGVPTSAKVTASITVEPSGRVQSVNVSGAPRGYPGLARCIESSVKGWTFPRGSGETVAQVPFMFVGQ